jgi:hypothetical protein
MFEDDTFPASLFLLGGGTWFATSRLAGQLAPVMVVIEAEALEVHHQVQHGKLGR